MVRPGMVDHIVLRADFPGYGKLDSNHRGPEWAGDEKEVPSANAGAPGMAP